jgi:hypothetical protein
MISDIIKFYKRHTFVIWLVGMSIFFLIMYIINRNSDTYVYLEDLTKYPFLTKNYRFTNWAKEPPKSKSYSKGELECREALEEIFHPEKFPSIRPDFLNNPVTGKNLEIDCYNSKLRLGVEYNGAQHSQFVPVFHKNKDKFTMQKYRDEIKNRICKDNNIILINVPHTVKPGYMKQFILNKLQEKAPHLIKKNI